LAAASVAVDGSKFKAVNNRDRNFTRAKMQRRMEQIETSVARFHTPKTRSVNCESFGLDRFGLVSPPNPGLETI
jgi:hypothetical protein